MRNRLKIKELFTGYEMTECSFLGDCPFKNPSELSRSLYTYYQRLWVICLGSVWWMCVN